jgi:hypothetical protein
MNKLCCVVLGLIVAAATAGCRGLAPPNWFHPGSAEYQQSQAQQFDPYPETDPGPTIVGARPLEYDKPPAEVLRVQPPRDQLRPGWLPWNWWRR